MSMEHFNHNSMVSQVLHCPILTCVLFCDIVINNYKLSSA